MKNLYWNEFVTFSYTQIINSDGSRRFQTELERLLWINLIFSRNKVQPRVSLDPWQGTRTRRAKFRGEIEAHGQGVKEKSLPAGANIHLSTEKKFISEAEELETTRAGERRRIKELKLILCIPIFVTLLWSSIYSFSQFHFMKNLFRVSTTLICVISWSPRIVSRPIIGGYYFMT